MKKIKALALGLALSGTLLSGTAFAASSGFSDVPAGSWYEADVLRCCGLGIVDGYADGTFQPGGSVTGAQFVTMLCRGFCGAEFAANSADSQFAGKSWYVPALYTARQAGILDGTALYDESGWSAAAGTNLTRYEMAVMLNNILGSQKRADAAQRETAQAALQDARLVPAKYQDAVLNCSALGVITGLSDGTFSGAQNMTRAQASAVCVRLFDLLGGTPASPAVQTPQEQEPIETTGAGLTITSKTETMSGNAYVRWNIANTNNTTGTLSNGKAITESNIQEILDVLRKQFPDGMTWTDRGAVGNNTYDNPGTVVQLLKSKYNVSQYEGCGGFAAMVSDAIFGKSANPARLLTDMTQIRTGDIIVRVKTSTGKADHIKIVTGTSGSTHTTSDGNCSSVVNWNCGSPDNDMYAHNNSLASHYYTYYVYTRYPE